jgi:hypothetical protein
MWLDTENWVQITAIILTGIGFVAVMVFNVAYFVCVLPYMRRRSRAKATALAAFGLIHGQVLEYCRSARRDASDNHRRAALAIKASLCVFAVCFVFLGIIVLMQL